MIINWPNPDALFSFSNWQNPDVMLPVSIFAALLLFAILAASCLIKKSLDLW